jgi:hypothetical protein
MRFDLITENEHLWAVDMTTALTTFLIPYLDNGTMLHGYATSLSRIQMI